MAPSKKAFKMKKPAKRTIKPVLQKPVPTFNNDKKKTKSSKKKKSKKLKTDNNKNKDLEEATTWSAWINYRLLLLLVLWGEEGDQVSLIMSSFPLHLLIPFRVSLRPLVISLSLSGDRRGPEEEGTQLDEHDLHQRSRPLESRKQQQLVLQDPLP